MKDISNLDNYNIPFVKIRKWSVLSVLLAQFVDILVYKPGVRGPPTVPELVTFLTTKYAFSHFSWYFFFKTLNLHLCRQIAQNLF